jgi:predicted amidohydrolase
VKTVRVAAISLVPTKSDLTGNADRLESAFREAHEAGAELAVAPEGVLEGYVVNEIIAGEVPAERMRDVAIPIDGPEIARFRELARDLGMCLAFGFAERIGDDVFNCAVFIDNEGKLCGRYHKMQLAEGYHPSWWFNRLGETSRAFDTPYGRCGILICNDRWNPALAKIPVLDGAQFLVIPSYGSTSNAQDEAVLARARENSVPIVEANVGVTLIVDENEIAQVDRNEVGMTLSDVTIGPPREVQLEWRDQVEREFLAWRRTEMAQRYKQRMDQLRRDGKNE